MLYLSRYLGDMSYGVVDTDDDVEEVVNRDDLIEACVKHKLRIEGVELGSNYMGAYLKSITVYQDERYYSTLQAKTKTLLGVDIRTFRGEIVYLKADCNVTPMGTVIRLSDFGDSFCGHSPVMWSINKPDNSLTLILDDALQISGRPPKMGTWGICYDVRELSDSDFIDEMYEDLTRSNTAEYVFWEDWILDRPDRFRFWQYVSMLDTVITETNEFVTSLQDLPERSEISKRIGEMYIREFEALANMDIEKTFFTSMSLVDFVAFVRNFLPSDVRPYVSCNKYDVLREEFIGIFQLLKFVSTLNSRALIRFENYIRYFDVADDIKCLFISLCNNSARGLRAYCKKLDKRGM